MYFGTNDGNSVCQFFDNPELASNIISMNEELIHRFGKYCSETADLYVQKYEWYYMPQSVHKLLIYGAQIIKEDVLPIGMMSEEA